MCPVPMMPIFIGCAAFAGSAWPADANIVMTRMERIVRIERLRGQAWHCVAAVSRAADDHAVRAWLRAPRWPGRASAARSSVSGMQIASSWAIAAASSIARAA